MGRYGFKLFLAVCLFCPAFCFDDSITAKINPFIRTKKQTYTTDREYSSAEESSEITASKESDGDGSSQKIPGTTEVSTVVTSTKKTPHPAVKKKTSPIKPLKTSLTTKKRTQGTQKDTTKPKSTQTFKPKTFQEMVSDESKYQKVAKFKKFMDEADTMELSRAEEKKGKRPKRKKKKGGAKYEKMKKEAAKEKLRVEKQAITPKSDNLEADNETKHREKRKSSPELKDSDESKSKEKERSKRKSSKKEKYESSESSKYSKGSKKESFLGQRIRHNNRKSSKSTEEILPDKSFKDQSKYVLPSEEYSASSEASTETSAKYTATTPDWDQYIQDYQEDETASTESQSRESDKTFKKIVAKHKVDDSESEDDSREEERYEKLKKSQEYKSISDESSELSKEIPKARAKVVATGRPYKRNEKTIANKRDGQRDRTKQTSGKSDRTKKQFKIRNRPRKSSEESKTLDSSHKYSSEKHRVKKIKTKDSSEEDRKKDPDKKLKKQIKIMKNKSKKSSEESKHSSEERSRAKYSSKEHSKVKHTSEEHSKEKHSSEEHSKAKHSAEEHSKAKHTSEEHIKAKYSSEEHSKAKHTSGEHSKAKHTSEEHSKAKHSSELSRAKYSSEEHSKAKHTSKEHIKAKYSSEERSKAKHSSKEHSKASLEEHEDEIIHEDEEKYETENRRMTLTTRTKKVRKFKITIPPGRNETQTLLGTRSFYDLVTQSDTFVDKTSLITDILCDEKILHFTRPRKWGRSMTIDMLKRFFELELDDYGNHLYENEKKNKQLFRGGIKIDRIPELDQISTPRLRRKKKKLAAIDALRYRVSPALKISKDAKAMMHLGRYPVMLFKFKNLRGDSYQKVMLAMKNLIFLQFKRYAWLLKKKIGYANKKMYIQYLKMNIPDDQFIKTGIGFLTKMIHKMFKKRVVFFIDDEDYPVLQYMKNNYFDTEGLEKIHAMTKEFITKLGEDPNVHQGIIFGTMHIKQTTGLLPEYYMPYSVNDPSYNTLVGFTDEEVDHLLANKSLPVTKRDLKKWYSGYNMGSKEMYNPWSVLNCIHHKGKIAPYFTDNTYTRTMRKGIPREVILKLIHDEGVSVAYLHQLLDFSYIRTYQAFIKSMMHSGYLTQFKNKLYIPNKEIYNFFSNTTRFKHINQTRSIESLEIKHKKDGI